MVLAGNLINFYEGNLEIVVVENDRCWSGIIPPIRYLSSFSLLKVVGLGESRLCELVRYLNKNAASC
jgi:hypothetical protein